MYGGYFNSKEQAEEYIEKNELYVMIPFFSLTKKEWCLIFDLKVKDSILFSEKRKVEVDSVKNCGNCEWYAKFEGVCCNGDSEYRADFRDCEDSCNEWEGQPNGIG